MPAQDADTIQDARAPAAASIDSADELQVQPAGFLIELSLDWIVLRASENVDRFIGESHVTLIDEPLGRFVQAQALHDLRNQFARLSGSTGVARAYRVRLADDRPRLDIAFQLSEGRVLLEAVPSPERDLGTAIGSVGGLIAGLAGLRGDKLLEAAARRVRALAGCDWALLVHRDQSGERSVHSSRAGVGDPELVRDLPAIVADSAAAPVPIFPRKGGDKSIARALLRAPTEQGLRRLQERSVGSAITVPLSLGGQQPGVIQCQNRTGRAPNLELHAAIELYAQLLAMRLEIDRLR